MERHTKGQIKVTGKGARDVALFLDSAGITPQQWIDAVSQLVAVAKDARKSDVERATALASAVVLRSFTVEQVE